MERRSAPTPESWRQKFRHAFRGFKLGVRGQSSFFVHFFFAAMVVAAALALGCTLWEWCLLTLCIASVLTAEMFNSALEHLAKAISHEQDKHLGAALDIGSASVLLAAIGAAIVGTTIFLYRFGILVGLWTEGLG